MAITGYQLTGATVTAVADRRLYEYLTSRTDGIISGCDVTYSGKIITVGNGYGFAKGCLFNITTQTLNPTFPTSGTYVGRVVVNIDADNNTATLTTQTGLPLPPLQQDDINNGGSLYQMVLANFSCSTSAITGLEQVATVTPNVMEGLFPIGSETITSTNSAPAFGTWTLVGKKFAEQTISSGIITSWDSRVSTSTMSAKLSGDCVRLDFTMVATSSSSSVNGGVMNLGVIGVDALPNFSFDVWNNGAFNVSRWNYVSGRSGKDFYSNAIPNAATYEGSVTLMIPSANKLDSFCDQFIWKRTA